MLECDGLIHPYKLALQMLLPHLWDTYLWFMCLLKLAFSKYCEDSQRQHCSTAKQNRPLRRQISGNLKNRGYFEEGVVPMDHHLLGNSMAKAPLK